MKLGVIGAGSWGTALAITAARAGSNVVLWSRSNGISDEINTKHVNTKYLATTPVHDNVKATSDIGDILTCDAIVFVVPAQSLRGVVSSLRGGEADVAIHSSKKDIDCFTPLAVTTPLIICSKGIEQESLSLMNNVVAEYFPENPVAILSGPNFADEIAKGLPAGATLACADKNVADKIIGMIGNKLFRLYYSNDVIGAQIGGAVKNVLAIACGIAIGRGLGENARAALVTRGIAEIRRLCVRIGGNPETLMGLSGIGDINLTCTSEKSRNMHCGVEIGKGKPLAEIMAGGKTVEGVITSKSVSMLAARLGIEMPIANAVRAILYENASIEETINSLLTRPFAAE